MAILLGLDLREQVTFQCAMTLLRALVIAVMVTSLLVGERSDFSLEPMADADGTLARALPLVRWAGLGSMTPIAVFCQLFQIGVPSLLQPLARKRDFGKIFGSALTCTFVMYTALGLAAVTVLGEDVDPSCNLVTLQQGAPTLLPDTALLV